MNANTQNAITAVLGLINPALGIIGAFVTGAAGVKVTGQVQDAVKVVGALMPLLDQFGDGQEVTPDQVRASLSGMNAALAEADALIAEREAAGE